LCRWECPAVLWLPRLFRSDKEVRMLSTVRAVAALPFAAAALAGFAASVVVHLYALMGREPPFAGPVLMAVLHGGVFAVFLPAMLLGGLGRRERSAAGTVGETGRRRRKPDVYVATILGVGMFPGLGIFSAMVGRVVGVMSGVLFVYVFVNFVLGFIGAAASGGKLSDPVLMYRMFSGHWMLFYWISLMMLWSVIVGAWGGGGARCVNGHRMPTGSVSCPVCGMPVSPVVTGQPEAGGGRESRQAGKDRPPDLPTIVR